MQGHQGYTGELTAEKAKAHGRQLEVVKHPEANKGFVLLPGRWVVEHEFAWASRFRRLVKDYGRLPETVAAITTLGAGLKYALATEQDRRQWAFAK